MAITIIRRTKPPAEVAPQGPALSGIQDTPGTVVTAGSAPPNGDTSNEPIKIHKTIKLGTAEIRPDHDLHMEQGKTKFIVHLRKPSWFRILAYDETTHEAKMASAEITFPTKLHRSLTLYYVVAVQPEGPLEPSKEVLDFVWNILSKVPPGGSFGDPAPAPASAAPKKPGLVIKRLAAK